jgi:hypothetical protein
VTPDDAWTTASIQSGPEDLLCCRREDLVAPTQRLATRRKLASNSDCFRHLDRLGAHDRIGDVGVLHRRPISCVGRKRSSAGGCWRVSASLLSFVPLRHGTGRCAVRSRRSTARVAYILG